MLLMIVLVLDCEQNVKVQILFLSMTCVPIRVTFKCIVLMEVVLNFHYILPCNI